MQPRMGRFIIVCNFTTVRAADGEGWSLNLSAGLGLENLQRFGVGSDLGLGTPVLILLLVF